METFFSVLISIAIVLLGLAMFAVICVAISTDDEDDWRDYD